MLLNGSRRLNNKISSLHEMITINNSRTPRERHFFFSTPEKIQTLATEIYKHIHGLSQTIMGEVVKINSTLQRNLKTQNEFFSRVHKTVKHATEQTYKNLGFSPRIKYQTIIIGNKKMILSHHVQAKEIEQTKPKDINSNILARLIKQNKSTH